MNCLKLPRNEIEYLIDRLNGIIMDLVYALTYAIDKVCVYIIEPSCSLVLLMSLQA